MLNSSRDTCTLLDLKPTSASVLKLAVVTVLAVASLAAMFAIFPQLHPDNTIFIKPCGQLCIIFRPILLPLIPFCLLFSNYYRFLGPPTLFSKLFPNTSVAQAYN